MTRKDELIIEILNKELKGIKKLLKEQEDYLNTIKKKGFDKEIHPGNHESILSGLNYTIGYCTCKIEETKKIIRLLKKSDYRDIEEIIEKNKEIEKMNKENLVAVFGMLKGKKNTLKKLRNKQWNRKKK